ncbi:MAG TPA: PEP-CTERM sorting domain-containing protein, partial [Phycisphaerae bacterium]|nr:PEP-CTERM sorting domain-containing protein [Phycisphaerae bacterium]HNU46703.1 PEP-CTERM sorting domain-containing protein [Phycisphaerae bacterium]
MTRLVVAGLLALVVVAGAPGARADMLIGASWDGTIYNIDPTTGLATDARTTHNTGLAGIALSPCGELYGYWIGGTGAPGVLGVIDIPTGTVGFIGSLPSPGGWSEGDLTVDRATGTLYLVPQTGALSTLLYIVDPNTAGMTLVGEVPIEDADLSALVFDAAGDLLALDTAHDTLVRLDPGTAGVLAITPLSSPLDAKAGMTVAPDGTLYVADGGNAGAYALYTLDAQTGALDPVGFTGIPNGCSGLAPVPEPGTLALLVLGTGIVAMRRPRKQRGYPAYALGRGRPTVVSGVQASRLVAYVFASSTFLLGAPHTRVQAQTTRTADPLGGSPSVAITLHGGFAACGWSTRTWVGEGQDPLVEDPVLLSLTSLPQGAEVVAAYINWSFLTNDPEDPLQALLTLNGSAVQGAPAGCVAPDLCWQLREEEPRFAYTVAYIADVTSIVQAEGGNGTYTVEGVVDFPPPPEDPVALGEGITLLVIYSHASEPKRLINVYTGLTTTEPEYPFARATLEFRNEAAESVPYIGSVFHFFLNALDGQPYQRFDDPSSYEDYDAFRLNGVDMDGFPGTVDVPGPIPNAWQGLLGPSPVFNLYDHADGDASWVVRLNHVDLDIETENIDDCISHSFAAISFVSLDWCDDGP